MISLRERVFVVISPYRHMKMEIYIMIFVKVFCKFVISCSIFEKCFESCSDVVQNFPIWILQSVSTGSLLAISHVLFVTFNLLVIFFSLFI